MVCGSCDSSGAVWGSIDRRGGWRQTARARMHVFVYMGLPASFQKKRQKEGGGSRSRLAAARLCDAVWLRHCFMCSSAVCCGVWRDNHQAGRQAVGIMRTS